MVNYLRMDLYHLIKSKMLYVCAALLAALCIIGCASIWYMTTPEFRDSLANATIMVDASEIDAGQEGADIAAVEITAAEEIAPTLEQYLGSIFVGSATYILLVALVLVLFAGVEFESGFIKNIFTTKKGRGAYYASKVAICIILSVAFLLVGIVVSGIGILVTGVEITFNPASFIPWALATVLTCSAYAMIALFFIMLTKSKTVGIVAACFVSTGLLGMLVASILSLFPQAAHLLDYTMFSGMSALETGLSLPDTLSAGHISVVASVYLVVFIVLGFVSIRKRDV